MLDKNAITKVADFITADDFYKESHKEVYQAMIDLFEKMEPIDIISLSSRLKERGQLEKIGGSAYLTSLINTVPTATHVSSYAKIVREKKVLRDLIEISNDIGLDAFDESQDVDILLDKAEKIRIVGEDTNIEIGVKNRPFIVDAGEENFPGGEIFNAPLEYETEGRIHFTYPAIRAGREVEDIVVEFKKGKVVKATARKNEKFLNAMLDTDKGSRYLGELGIGFNPKVTKFTKDLLFDEKLGGSIHCAFGMAYTECKGTNKSALHWDIVKDLRKYGKIIADNKVVQRNGKWLV